MTFRESMPENRDCGADAAAYVLGALDGAEAEAFRAHLATCAVCRDEVNAFQEVADSLPLVAPSQQLPRGLKRRVMTEVRSDARAAKGTRRSFRLPSLLTAMPSPALAVAAVLLALVVVGGAIAIGTSSGGAATHTYSASVVGPGSASLRVSGGRGELVLQGMPSPPGNDIYEVWLKRGDSPPSPTTALFSVTSNGSGTVAVPGKLKGGDAVLVTPEPPGGSSAPTHSPVIVARLS
jgi:anti-sigma-K factor RskA